MEGIHNLTINKEKIHNLTINTEEIRYLKIIIGKKYVTKNNNGKNA